MRRAIRSVLLRGTAARSDGLNRLQLYRQLASSSAPNVTNGRSRALSVAAGVGVLGFAASSLLDPSQADAASDVKDVRTAIADLVEKGHGPLLIRLAWHASGTYDKVSGTGGSDGAKMRFAPEKDHGANAGLVLAQQLLEPIKAAYPNISYADLWTLAGVVAVEESGGPTIAWRAGRKDEPSGEKCTPDGRLPDADKGKLADTVQHIRDIFHRMGFNDKEIVALLGAHSMGRCHTDRSGYWGPWTRAETTFSNLYYKELLENTWTLKKWKGPDQFEDPTGELMMLPADMALIWDKEFRKHVETYARDDEVFFQDFSKAYTKLLELGVPAFKKPFWQFW